MKKAVFIALVIFMILIIIILTATGLGIIIRTDTKNLKSEELTIVVDCGHGGADGGAVGSDGTMEKDINFSLGLKLQELLKQNGYNVQMTRTEDNFICDDFSASLAEQNTSDLHNRLKIAESFKNAVFISIHMNKFSESKYWGTQVFYSPNNPESKILAEYIRSSVVSGIQKGNERANKEMDSSVYIIYNATMPAVLLECGFMSNAEELENFKDEKYQSEYISTVFNGLNKFIKSR